MSRRPFLMLNGKEIKNPIVRTLILISVALFLVTVLVVMPILELGLFTTVAIAAGLIFISTSAHFILRAYGRKSFIQVMSGKEEETVTIIFNPLSALDKLTH